MLAAGPGASTAQARFHPDSILDPRLALPPKQEVSLGPQKLTEVATPFWMTGFAPRAFDHFAPALRAAGFEPVQGVSGAGGPPQLQSRPGFNRAK